MIAQGAFDTLDGPAGNAGGIGGDSGTEFDEGVEDGTGGIDSGEAPLFVDDGGEDLVTVVVGLFDSGAVVFGAPDGHAGFLPQVDVAGVEVGVVEWPAVVDSVAEFVAFEDDGAEGPLGRKAWRVLPSRYSY
jgi:hypothetical protein